MFGADLFAGAPFAGVEDYSSAAAAAEVLGGHFGFGPSKKKHRQEEFANWPAMIWPSAKALSKPWPETPIELETEPLAEMSTLKAPAYVPKPEMVRAAAQRIDPSIRNKIVELQRRRRMEREDEEALFLLGAFD